MTTLVDKINQIEFTVTKNELADALDASFDLASDNLSDDNSSLFRYDLDYFLEKGRWLVHNTFAGGIIFLREPETINKIEILFQSDKDDAIATVEYASEKRNSRNVKYKPDVGQIESATWFMGQVFPNFNKHQKDIKLILMAIVGNITKDICEKYRRDTWFMKFDKPFDLRLFLDGRLELNYRIEV